MQPIVKYPLASTSPAIDAEAVTPSDTADIPGRAQRGPTRGILVGASGDVAVVMSSGRTVVWPALAAGIIHPISCTRVKSTGTAATGIVAVW